MAQISKRFVEEHSQASALDPIILLPDEAQNNHPIRYEDITAEKVRKAPINTKGGSSPSGLDADGWRRILASNCFGDSSSDLSRVIASFTRKVCLEKLVASSLEAFLACRFIHLDKNPGLCPIGAGKNLRRIAGKVVHYSRKFRRRKFRDIFSKFRSIISFKIRKVVW